MTSFWYINHQDPKKRSYPVMNFYDNMEDLVSKPEESETSRFTNKSTTESANFRQHVLD